MRARESAAVRPRSSTSLSRCGTRWRASSPEPPGRVVAVGAVAEHEPEGLLVDHVEELADHLERRLVGPVQVVEDDDERLLAGQLR